MAHYEEWIKRAKSSLELAQAKKTQLIFYEDLCFQSQQAAEKALKGLLIFFGIEPELTHNIEVLLNELKKFSYISDEIKEASKLTIYAIQTRYPGQYDEITKDEYEKSVETAKACLDWVEKTIKDKIVA